MASRCRGEWDDALAEADAVNGAAARTASPVPAAVAGWSTGLAAEHRAAIEVAAERLVDCRRMPESARAHHDAAVLAVRPRHVTVRATHGWASLTASEQAIVGLVGERLTNTEIGQRLYIYRRTVESHLGRVYAKLGLTTRGQLVAAAGRRREGEGDAT